MAVENSILYLCSTMAQVWSALMIFQFLFYEQKLSSQLALEIGNNDDRNKKRILNSVFKLGVVPIVFNIVVISFTSIATGMFNYVLLIVALLFNLIYLLRFYGYMGLSTGEEKRTLIKNRNK